MKIFIDWLCGNKLPKNKIKVKGVDVSKVTYKDGIMTVFYNNWSFTQYKGESTVWYELPLMRRAATSRELKLCEYYKYITYYKGDYPTAHLRK